MATLQSLGVGSGMDIASLVTELVAAERAPKQQQITKQQSTVAVQLSAMGTLKGALGGFQSALTPLKTAVAFDVFSAKSADEEIFTATASASAPMGSYDIDVINLAAAHQLSSKPFTESDEVVGTGSLTFSSGDKTFTIEIDSENSTLEGIRDAINSADDNSSVRATIVNGTDGAHLVLTAAETGEDNAITVTTSGGDGGLERLTYTAENEANYDEVREAKDALIEIAGSQHTSASNVVKDAIEGVTIKLVKADPGNPVSLDIDRNIDTAMTRITAFVNQYNSLAGTIANLQRYDAATKQAGPLLGDAMLRNVESNLRRELGRSIEGASEPYKTLSSLGITMKLDGKLEIDQTKLRDALDSDFAAVQRVFTSDDGIAVRMDEMISPHLSVDGSIAERNKSLDQRTKNLENEQIALDARMQVIQARYLKQFTALDGLLAQFQSTSAYLTQQLSNLPKIGG